MQNYSPSLYCSSYEVLLELANCFTVFCGIFFLNYQLSIALLESLFLGYAHISYCSRGSLGNLSSQGEKGANIHWMILKWETFGQWLISSPQSKSATFPCQMVCEIYFWASSQRQAFELLWGHISSPKLLWTTISEVSVVNFEVEIF